VSVAGYVVVEIEVADAAGYDEYKDIAPASIKEYGGRYLVRGGKCDALEGGWMPKRLVVLEFPSWSRRARGGIRRPTPGRRRSASAPRARAWC
jgi:uncharacterized protein (DUF1330 family)